jgi:hypothetical protein
MKTLTGITAQILFIDRHGSCNLTTVSNLPENGFVHHLQRQQQQQQQQLKLNSALREVTA